MEDNSDSDSSPCQDGFGCKLSVRKRRTGRRMSRKSTSFRGETTSQPTVLAPTDQMKASDPDSFVKEHSGGHNGSAANQANVHIKEEQVSSGEEDIFCKEGQENVSSGRGEEQVFFREEDRFTGEENMSTRRGGGQVSTRRGRGQVSTRRGRGQVSTRRGGGQVSTRRGGGKVSTKQAEGQGSSRRGEGQVSSSEKDTPGVKDMGNVEAVLIQDSPINQHKRKRNTLKFSIGRSKEISEDLRKQVVEAHKGGKGYKRIAKDLDLHLSTVRKIVYKWKKFSTVATLPRSGRPTKIGAKARRTILKYMMENPRVTAKDLKASLALDNINVHESTIRKTLNKWCSWDFTIEEGTDLQKE